MSEQKCAEKGALVGAGTARLEIHFDGSYSNGQAAAQFGHGVIEQAAPSPELATGEGTVRYFEVSTTVQYLGSIVTKTEEFQARLWLEVWWPPTR